MRETLNQFRTKMNALIVAVTSGPAGAATESKQDAQIVEEAAIKASVQIMDDWDESDRAKVNPVDGQAGVEAGSGVDTVKTQRMSLATDVPLPAGTNLIGKSGIDQTTPGTTNGVQINAALPAGANLIGKAGIDQTTPGTTNGVQVNAALPSGTNLLGKTGIDQTTPGTTNGVAVNSALPAGTNNIGDVDIVSQPADTFVAEGGALGKGVLLQGDDGTDRKNLNVDLTTGNAQVDVIASALPIGAATSANQALILAELVPIAENSKSYEDASFVTGDSPVVLDFNTDLGRNALDVIILNDGPGSFTIAMSKNGSDWGDEVTMKSGELRTYSKRSVDSLRITWVADSAYRVEAL